MHRRKRRRLRRETPGKMHAGGGSAMISYNKMAMTGMPNPRDMKNDRRHLEVKHRRYPYRQLRARRALMMFDDDPLRTKGMLSLYKVYGDIHAWASAFNGGANGI